MHILMEGRQLVEIGFLFIRFAVFQAVDHRVFDGAHILKRLVQIRQIEIPSCIVMNFHRVVEFIGLGQNRIRFVNTPENEMFVKPSQMPDLPEQWIDDVEPRPHQLIVVEAVNQLNRAPPGILEIGNQSFFRQSFTHLAAINWSFMKITIVTPAKRGDRSGNRATANRWSAILKKLGHRPRTLTEYDGAPSDAMLAIHAWRSASSIRRFREDQPHIPLILCLAGTDINSFQTTHPKETHGSMALADHLVCLHNRVACEIPRRFHRKLRVIRQSAPPIRRKHPLKRKFEIIVAGHLRDEKDPMRAAKAVRRLPDTSLIQIVHMGKAIDNTYRDVAVEEMSQNARYHWVGEVPRWQVRQEMARARAMVISSRQEGGANVVSEAIMAGLPVIASKINGNVGLLGADYQGYFPTEDTLALAKLLMRLETDKEFCKSLSAQVRALRPEFTEKRELAAWKSLLASLNQGA